MRKIRLYLSILFFIISLLFLAATIRGTIYHFSYGYYNIGSLLFGYMFSIMFFSFSLRIYRAHKRKISSDIVKYHKYNNICIMCKENGILTEKGYDGLLCNSCYNKEKALKISNETHGFSKADIVLLGQENDGRDILHDKICDKCGAENKSYIRTYYHGFYCFDCFFDEFACCSICKEKKVSHYEYVIFKKRLVCKDCIQKHFKKCPACERVTNKKISFYTIHTDNLERSPYLCDSCYQWQKLYIKYEKEIKYFTKNNPNAPKINIHDYIIEKERNLKV